MAAPLIWPLVATDKASAAFNRVSASMERTAASGTKAMSSVERTSKRMAVVGSAMTKAVTVPLLAAAGVAIAQASKFQQATNVYVTAAGESRKNLAIVQAGIKRIAVQTGTAIDNLTSAQYLIEKAGYRGASGLKILDASAKGAREENAQLSDVVQAMTSVMASYHLKASQSVQVMNALKTGAGQAKVTMEDFAGALSTVIPIASANKISLQQVFGAFATLTQHGTDAREATQELGATIRSLAAPNRVAMNQMQQLGLSVNDVTSNLGKRGLTGTIDLLVNTITSHMGKAGLVIQNAFNQSKSAGQDVGVMLSQLPPKVKALADEYMKGKLSLSDWTSAVKALPGPQASLAKQFATLENKAAGFNTLLRTGDPAAQTFVSALKKMAGGSIGLNTVLQLMGGNMAGFKARTDAVGKSLNDSSKQVEGWASTSKLMSVQADQLKEKFQVLAINLGTALIPVFSKIVSGISGVVDWFTKLSGTQKSMLGWSLAVVAAMGPILKIGSLLMSVGVQVARFATFAGAQLASFALRSEVSSAMVATSMTRITGALGGAAIGYAVGSFTQHASTTAKWLGVLGSAAAGAAFGSAGGPIGALIGGLAGGAAAAAKSFIHLGDTGKLSTQYIYHGLSMDKGAADALLSSLEGLNGAYNKQYRSSVVQSLQKGGILSAGEKLGISAYKTTSAALGDPKALGQIAAHLARISQTAGGLAKASQFFGALHRSGIELGGIEKKYEQYMRGVYGSVMAGQKLGTNLTQLHKDFKSTGTSLDQTTAYGKRNIAMVTALVGGLDKARAAERAHGASVKQAASDYHGMLQALGSNLVQLGFNSKAVQSLIGKLSAVGAMNVHPKVQQQGAQQSQQQASGLAGYLQSLGQKTYTPTITVDSTGATMGAAAAQHAIDSVHSKTVYINVQTIGKLAKATGGYIAGPGTGTSDSIPAMLSNGEYVINARQTRKHRALLEQINRGVQGFAGGGIVHRGKDWIFDGIRYASRRAALNAEHRYGTTHNPYQTASTAVGNVGNLPSPKFTLGKVGDYAIVMRQIERAWGTISDHLKTATARHFRSLLRLYTREAKQQLVGLERSILQSRLTNQITHVGSRLQSAQQRLSTVQGNYQQLYGTVRGAVGGFDITTAGTSVYADKPGVSGGSILAQLQKAAGQARQFGALLKKLRKEGLAKQLIIQLAQAGPAALPQAQALASATPKVLAQIDSSYASLSQYGSQAGKFAAGLQYGKQLDASQDLVHGLLGQKHKLSQAFKEIGRDTADEIIREFNHRNDKHGHGHHHVHHHTHVHGVTEPAAVVAAVERRQRMRARA